MNYQFVKGEHVFMHGVMGGVFMATVLAASEREVEVVLNRAHYKFQQGTGHELRGPGWAHRFITPFKREAQAPAESWPYLQNANLALVNLCNINLFEKAITVKEAKALAEILEGLVDKVAGMQGAKAPAKPKPQRRALR